MGRRRPRCAGPTSLKDPRLSANPRRGFERPRREGGGKSRAHGVDWLPVSTGRGERRLLESRAESRGGEHPVFVAGLSGSATCSLAAPGRCGEGCGPRGEGRAGRACDPDGGREVEDPSSSSCPSPGRGALSGRRLLGS